MIYVASPYTHYNKEVMQQRYEEVAEFCASAAKRGYFAYSPIAHWHPIAEKHNLPRDEAWWRALDEDAIIVSKQLWVLMLDGWETSVGVTREILFAKTNTVRLHYIPKGGLEDVPHNHRYRNHRLRETKRHPYTDCLDSPKGEEAGRRRSLLHQT